MHHIGRRFASGLLVVGLVLCGSLASAQVVVGPGNAALLFPYVTTEAGKFTFITINNVGLSTLGTPIPAYHFSYAMKPVTGAPNHVVNKAGCEHFDADVVTTPADMMIFEVGGKVTTDAGTSALFEGGLTAPVTSLPLTFPVAGRVGFLIVETNTPVVDSLFGTTTLIDSAAGLVVSLSTDFLSSAIATNPDFSGIDGAAVLPGIGATGFKALSWFPTDIIDTSWFVIPLGDRVTMAPPGGGGIRRAIVPYAPVLPAPGVQGAHDLDEQFFSGGKTAPVRCFGYIDRDEILQPGTDLATAGGGWTAVASTLLTLPASDLVDPSGSYTPGPFLMIAGQVSAALGAPMMTVHRVPDLVPCFSPAGFGLTCPGGGP